MDRVLIVGGGITGLQAAQSLSRMDIETVLVEQSDELGGNLKALGSTFPEGRSAPDLIAEREGEITASSRATVLTGTEIASLTGGYPRFNAVLSTPEGSREIACKSVIVSTGYTPFNPSGMRNYGFAKHPDIITALELALKIKENDIVKNSDGEPPASVAFIQCIGSRDERTHTYCSAFCCMYAVHFATQLRQQLSRCAVTILYMDLRTPFCAELNYETARRNGVKFVRSRPARVRAGRENGQLTVQYEDTLDGTLRFLDTEMVVLSIGAEPPSGTEKLAAALSIDREESGFIKGDPLPVFTGSPGVLVAGAASGPKDITTCLAEGAAAAAQAAILTRG